MSQSDNGGASPLPPMSPLPIPNVIAGKRGDDETRGQALPIHQIRDAVIFADPDGRVTSWNRGAEVLYGLAAEEILGKHLTELYEEDYRNQLVRQALDRLGELDRCEIELPVKRGGGDRKWVHLSLSLVRGPDGMPVGIIGYSINFTERRRAAESLRESEERFQMAAAAVDALIYEYDLRKQTVFRSQGLLAVLGFRPEEAPPSAEWWQERIHPDDRPRVLAQAAVILASETLCNLEYRVLHRRGHYVHVWDRARIVRDDQGHAIRVVGCTVNVTDRKRAEAALRESEERYRLLSELTSDYTYTCRVYPDGTLRMEAATEGFTRITGYTLEEVSGPGGWATFIHPLDLPCLDERTRALLTGKNSVDELRFRTKQGETRWVRYSLRPIWDDARRRVVCFHGATQDITEQKQYEAKLQDYAQRLRTLSRRLLEVQEAERRHLARELHDEVAQALTALNLALEMSTRLQGEPQRGTLGEAQAQVKDLTTRVRDLSLRLRPTMLDDLGLLPALVWHFQRYMAQTRLRVEFQHTGVSRRFNHDVETGAYRIIQEALTNVARHASVDVVTVRLWLDGQQLCLQVEDQGVGFNPRAALTSNSTSGLSGMQERAVLLGGRLVVESVRGAGTCVTAELPVGVEEKTAHGPDSAAG